MQRVTLAPGAHHGNTRPKGPVTRQTHTSGRPAAPASLLHQQPLLPRTSGGVRVRFELQQAGSASLGRATGPGGASRVRGGSREADAGGQRAYLLISRLCRRQARSSAKSCKTATIQPEGAPQSRRRRRRRPAHRSPR
eukprot:scaffold3951_cov121-Isochrysis_galbana.AAC.6